MLICLDLDGWLSVPAACVAAREGARGVNPKTARGGEVMRKIICFVFTLFMAIALVSCGNGEKAQTGQKAAQSSTHFVTIGTGGITGVYYPTGGAIARIVNKKKDTYHIRCTVESTGGSVFNVNAIMAGDLEFGVVQSDRQYQAIKGMAEWEQKGPQNDLRAVFSIHPESVTLVAAVDANIMDIRDLKGKRVNIGNPGSGQRQNSIDALAAVGLNYETDIIAESVKAAEAPGLLQDGRIDAFFYTVGHPSGAIKEATAGARKVRFVPITGVESLFEKYPYYAPSFVPVKLYPGAVNDSDVTTFGVKATFVTSAKVSEDVVYAITKEVFDNFDDFKSLHPAYAVLTKEGMLEGLSAPIHPGAMKYYKEAGMM
jgi:TRAP transporter TAXI family solute receptor